MNRVRERCEPRYLYDGQYGQDGPLGPPCEPVNGAFLLGALILCLDFWLFGVLAVRWLT